MTETCLWCEEPVEPRDSPVPISTLERIRYTHRECALREVLGGIGHHIAHEYWCGAPRHDPDAGLTRRQSAVLVFKLYELLGDEVVARANRGVSSRASDEEDPLVVWGWDPASDDDEEWGVAVVRWAEEGSPPEEGPPPRPRRDPEQGSGSTWGPPVA